MKAYFEIFIGGNVLNSAYPEGLLGGIKNIESNSGGVIRIGVDSLLSVSTGFDDEEIEPYTHILVFERKGFVFDIESKKDIPKYVFVGIQ